MKNRYNPPRNESGVPLGGIGAGKIEFCADGRFTNVTTNNNWDCPIYNGTAGFPLFPRIKEGAPGSIDENAQRRQSITSYEGLPGAWMAVYTEMDGARVLKTHGRPAFTCMPQAEIEYTGRFPIAAVQYKGLAAVRLGLKAFSSFMLGDRSEDYHDSALPLALFAFDVENITGEEQSVSLAFSWQNLNGVGGYAWVPINEPDPTSPIYREDETGRGLWFGHDPQTEADPRVVGDYSLMAWSSHASAQTSWLAGWEASGHGEDVWAEFAQSGQLPDRALPYTAGALAVRLALKPGEQAEVVFALGWSMPHLLAAETQWEHLVRPSGSAPAPQTPDRKDYGHAYNRWYADSWEIASYGIAHWAEILARIEAWQGLFTGSNLPARLIDALCNDLFPLYAGTWYTRDLLCAVNESPTDMNGCMGTLDQRGVGHAASVTLFPELNKAELALFARNQIGGEDDPRHFSRHYDMRTGRFDYPLNMEGAILHDVGWDHLEAGRLGDQVWLSSHWPELTSLFVLQCYQHAIWNGDREWLDTHYPQMKAALHFQARMDQDGDGVAELWGVGSNTYDTELYPYYGATPYIATLYLAALRAGMATAEIKGDREFIDWAAERFEKARKTLERDLWNDSLGYYYAWLDRNYLAWKGLPGEHAFAGTHSHISQLAGEFYANLLDLGDLVDPERRARTVRSIGERNVGQVPGVPADEFHTDGSYSQAMSAMVLGYYGAFATAAGSPDLGWEAVEKVYRVRYDLDGSPWDAPLQWSGPGNTQAQWGRWYFSTPASWYYLWSLGGVHYNRLTGELWLNPSWPSAWGERLERLPVFLPGFQAEISASRANGAWEIDFRIKKLLRGRVEVKSICVSIPEYLIGKKVIVKSTALLDGEFSILHGKRLCWNMNSQLEQEGDGFSMECSAEGKAE